VTRVLLLGGESDLVGAQVAMMWPQTRESLVVEWGKRRMTWWHFREGGNWRAQPSLGVASGAAQVLSRILVMVNGLCLP
jgi:hypothetical protein